MCRESEPAVRPAEAMQSQRVIAKEAEVKELTLLLEEVILGQPTSHSWLYITADVHHNDGHVLRDVSVGLCRPRRG